MDRVTSRFSLTTSAIIFSLLFLSFSISWAAGLEFITDNSDSTACFAVPTLSWYSSNWGTPYGPDKLYTTKGDGSKTVTWVTKLPFGRYDIKAWINSAPYASDAHYLIIHSQGTTAVTRNQNLAPNGWSIDLGTYDFDTVGIVILNDYWTGPETYVVADAIKYIEVSTTQISWSTFSPTDAVTIATSQNLPIMMYFSTDKSLDCQKMKSETFNDPTVIKWTQNFVTVHIQAETNPQPLQKFGVYKVPTILILDSFGKEKKRIEGFISANDLTKELNTYLSTLEQ